MQPYRCDSTSTVTSLPKAETDGDSVDACSTPEAQVEVDCTTEMDSETAVKIATATSDSGLVVAEAAWM